MKGNGNGFVFFQRKVAPVVSRTAVLSGKVTMIGVFFPDLHHMPMQGFDKMVGNILLVRLGGVLDRTALGGVYARHEALTVPRISMNLCLYGVIPFFSRLPIPTGSRSSRKWRRV